MAIEANAGQGAGLPVVVVGTIGHDCHVVGISVIRHKLERAGVKVVFLGAMAPPEEFVAVARETAADCVFVSSLYGMGRFDCADLRARFREAGIGDTLLYVGGVLVTDPEEWDKTREVFLDLGFDRVYPPGTTVETAIEDLRQDMIQRGRAWAPEIVDA